MNTPADQISVTQDRHTKWSLMAGAVIWFLHLNVVYPITSLACRWGWFPYEILGMSGLRFVQIVLTVFAVLMVVITIYIPWRNWRHYQVERDEMQLQTEEDRRPFVAFVAMAVNSFFLIFVVASFVPVLTLNPCG